MSLSKDWIWCQYTPGSGGKTLLTLMQLSKKIHSWYDELDTNFEKFVEERIMIDPEVHMQKEIQPPYDISWYTRQLPFTRGDDLSEEEAGNIFKENNKQYDQTLVMPWTKPYLPKWYKGKVIAILNDPASMDFLKKRRDVIFYKWEGNTVFQKRFMPQHCANPHLATRFNDNPKYKEVFETKESFYDKEFYNHPEMKGLTQIQTDPRVVYNINLSDLLTKPGSEIATRLNNIFNLDIDLDKADYLYQKWVSYQTTFHNELPSSRDL